MVGMAGSGPGYLMENIITSSIHFSYRNNDQNAWIIKEI